jgi:hypothetical protein
MMGLAVKRSEVMPLQTTPSISGAPVGRDSANRRLAPRRHFAFHLVAYVVVNAWLVLLWSVTGAGYFWPAWVLCGWGVGLLMHAMDVFVWRPVTEADTDPKVRHR